MGLVVGTNCGFVTTAPTVDPSAITQGGLNGDARVSKDTSPATAGKIVEIGWWSSFATEEANFEVGLYAADGAVIPGEAGTLLEVSRTNAKGTTAGWKVVTGLNWTISPNTAYWIGVQCDGTVTLTNIDAGFGGLRHDFLPSQSTLPDPFGGGLDGDVKIALYTVWEEVTGTNLQINIGDVWKEIPAMQINIGDAWKEIAGIQINIGDTWKTVF